MASTVPGTKDIAGHKPQTFPLREVWYGGKQMGRSAEHHGSTQEGEGWAWHTRLLEEGELELAKWRWQRDVKGVEGKLYAKSWEQNSRIICQPGDYKILKKALYLSGPRFLVYKLAIKLWQMERIPAVLARR